MKITPWWLNLILGVLALIPIESTSRGRVNRCSANLRQMMQNLKLNCKYTKCNQEWVRILREGLWNYSWFLWIMSWGALIALLIQHKHRHKNKTKHVYDKSNKSDARYKRELREKIQTQTWRYISMIELLLYVPAFTQKDFHYATHDLPQRDLYWGITTQHREYTTPLSNTKALHKRWVEA